MSALGTFPPPIRRYLADFVARSRRLRVLRALLVATAFAVAFALAACVADRFFGFAPWVRVGLLSVLGAGVLTIVGRAVAGALLGPVDWVRASEEIEARDARLGQRLVTVTSQMLTPARYRGSEQLLGVLVEQVSAEVASASTRRLVRLSSAARPAGMVVCLLALAGALALLPWLNLPLLLVRLFQPLADVPPVTTTRIDVTPAGAVSLDEREPLPVKAVVTRLRPGAYPVLHSSADGRAWTATPMLSTVADTWVLTLPAADRDYRFYVRAGDAATPTTRVRVLRRPSVAEFRIRYTYPAYTGRPPLSVHNNDGLVEAPHGTEAQVTVVATEPLASAALVIKGEDGRRIELEPTGEANVRAARVPITNTRDLPCDLELTSDRGVRGQGPPTIVIRSVPDRVPLVRLLQPAADLRLSPQDIVPLTYQALDDYGIGRLWAAVQVNAGAPVEYPLRLKTDPRRVEGTFDLDLALLKVKVGDVVAVTLRAADRAGQNGASEARHFLVSPRSVDVPTHQRMSELGAAVEHARDWVEGLARAQDLVERARKVRPDRDADVFAAFGRASRQLIAAQESGTLLRQALLRATMYGASPRMCDALANCVDSAATQLDGVDRVDAALFTRKPIDDSTAGRMGRTLSAARELAQQLRVLLEGEQAGAILADRATLQSQAPVRPASATSPADREALDRRRQMIVRTRQDVAAALERLKINPDARNVDDQLRQRVDAARRVVEAARPVDLVGPAWRWGTDLRNRQPYPPRLEERLYAAAQAESVRPDAELVAARDLHLAARAASALSDQAAALARQARADAAAAAAGAAGAAGAGTTADPAMDAAGPDGAGADGAGAEPVAPSAKERDRATREAWGELGKALEQYPAALAALRAEYDVARKVAAAATPAEARKVNESAGAVHAAAAAARQRMLAWAAGPGATADEIAAKVREVEDLAVAANAATAERDYDRAAGLDRRLAGALSRPELAHAADAPRAIDTVSRTQEKLADQTAGADDVQAAAIAGVQKQVADEIARTGTAAAADDPAAPAPPVDAGGAGGAGVAGGGPADPFARWASDAADSRQLATAAITAAQEKLALLPGQFAEARRLAEASADLTARLAAARAELASAGPAMREAAGRVVAQVAADLEQAATALEAGTRPIAPRAAEDLAESLRPFAPDTIPAVAAIEQDLKPALRDLQRALADSGGGRDRDAVEPAARAARAAIRQAQDALREAQAKVIERDPLVTARWFARAAADALTAAPPKRQAAAAHQQKTLEALQKAGVNAVRRSKNQRLSAVPSYGAFYTPPAGPGWGEGDQRLATDRLLQSIPGLGEWGRLRHRTGESLSAPVRDADPPGFSESLRLYFEVLGREESKGPDGK